MPDSNDSPQYQTANLSAFVNVLLYKERDEERRALLLKRMQPSTQDNAIMYNSPGGFGLLDEMVAKNQGIKDCAISNLEREVKTLVYRATGMPVPANEDFNLHEVEAVPLLNIDQNRLMPVPVKTAMNYRQSKYPQTDYHPDYNKHYDLILTPDETHLLEDWVTKMQYPAYKNAVIQLTKRNARDNAGGTAGALIWPVSEIVETMLPAVAENQNPDYPPANPQIIYSPDEEAIKLPDPQRPKRLANPDNFEAFEAILLREHGTIPSHIRERIEFIRKQAHSSATATPSLWHYADTGEKNEETGERKERKRATSNVGAFIILANETAEDKKDPYILLMKRVPSGHDYAPLFGGAGGYISLKEEEDLKREQPQEGAARETKEEIVWFVDDKGQPIPPGPNLKARIGSREAVSVLDINRTELIELEVAHSLDTRKKENPTINNLYAFTLSSEQNKLIRQWVDYTADPEYSAAIKEATHGEISGGTIIRLSEAIATMRPAAGTLEYPRLDKEKEEEKGKDSRWAQPRFAHPHEYEALIALWDKLHPGALVVASPTALTIPPASQLVSPKMQEAISRAPDVQAR